MQENLSYTTTGSWLYVEHVVGQQCAEHSRDMHPIVLGGIITLLANHTMPPGIIAE